MPATRPAAMICAALLIAGCGGGGNARDNLGPAPGQPPGAVTTTTATTALPGAGRPPVTVGDKNFTEQFILGELYAKALTAQGYDVELTENIGTTNVTLQALSSGLLDLYPEYLSTWDSTIAGIRRRFRTEAGALSAGRRYARSHGLELLAPTPFSDTSAVVTTDAYAAQNGLRSIPDLARVAPTITFGGAPQFEQDPAGLPVLERAYGFTPARVVPLAVGGQYDALDAGTVQAAATQTTDGELATGGYAVLLDPRRVFGYGEAVPVVSAKVMAAEGPAFAQTIDAVTALLTTPIMRQLNAAVDLYHQDPATVAQIFLQSHGLVAPASSQP